MGLSQHTNKSQKKLIVTKMKNKKLVWISLIFIIVCRTWLENSTKKIIRQLY